MYILVDNYVRQVNSNTALIYLSSQSTEHSTVDTGTTGTPDTAPHQLYHVHVLSNILPLTPHHGPGPVWLKVTNQQHLPQLC